MGKRIFTASVILAESPGDTPHVFNIGDEVPEWALDKVGDHVTQGNTRADTAPVVPNANVTVADDAEDATDDDSDVEEEADEAGEYDELNKDELKKLARTRGISGYSNMDKASLILALETDDEDADEEDEE